MSKRYTIAVPMGANNGQRLQELETWSQRTNNRFNWVDTPIGNRWSAKIMINGNIFGDVQGTGNDKQAARTEVVIALNARDPPVFVRVPTGI